MKIGDTGNQPLRLLDSGRAARAEGAVQERNAQNAATPTPPGASVQVSLSPEADFVQSTREAAEPPRVRDHIVETVRAEIAEGTFDGSIDLDKVLDSLLADL